MDKFCHALDDADAVQKKDGCTDHLCDVFSLRRGCLCASPNQNDIEPPPAGEHPIAKAPLEGNRWLHQAEGQARLDRIIDAELQEAREQRARQHEENAAQAYAFAYAFTTSHNLLPRTGQSYERAQKLPEALLLYERLLAKNPEPLLKAQASELDGNLKAKPKLANLDADATTAT